MENRSKQSKDKTEYYLLKGIHFASGKNVTIEIENGIILTISESTFNGQNEKELIISPGFIDNQVNGYAGVDFSHETFSPEGMKIAVNAIWKDGVTTFLPTLITNSHENLIRNLKILSAVTDDPEIMGCIPGIHLEGPYLSEEEGFYGCHPVQHLRKPSWDEFCEYQEAAGGKIIQVTISPELEGAMEFIKLCRENGVIVSIGHSNATSEQIYKAVESGARLSTHLGNGCANLINRHRNPIWPQLANDLLTPSIIADGHHLPSDVIRIFYKVKGPDNLFLTSDVTHLIGMSPGKYIYMGNEVIYTEDGLIKNPVLNCLAGASLPLKKGVETMMNYTGCSLADAIKMASGNIARILGLEERGSLTPGKRADIILFEKKGNQLHIKETWVRGIRVS